MGISSYVPFQYKAEFNNQGHIHEVNILKPDAKLFDME